MGVRGHRALPTIPSCLMGKVRFLVINILNDCRICICLIVCMCV